MVWGMLAAAAIGAGASYFGGRATNKANQAIASSASAKNVKMMREGHAFSSAQARLAEQYTTRSNLTAWGRDKWAAQKQMDFQERMSNTQFRRGMADMRQAGLNPILAYAQGGAGGASGAAANATSGQGVAASASSAKAEMIPAVNELEMAVSGAKQTMRLSQELKNMKQAETTDRARQYDLHASKVNKNASTVLQETQTNNERIRRKILEYQVNSAKAKSRIDKREADDTTQFGTTDWSKNIGGVLRLLETLGISLPNSKGK